MDQARLSEGAERLNKARRTGRPIEAALAQGVPADLDEAYAIQSAGIPGILAGAGGGGPIGYKIGCTNAAAQQLLGIPHPVHGVLLSPFAHESPARLDAGAFHIRVIEPEIAFRLARDLPPEGAPYAADELAPALAAVMGAIEVVDTRYANWTTVGALNLIADNASAGHWVKGAESADVAAVDYVRQPVRLYLNGAPVQEGVAGNALGSSLKALAWLANALAARGPGLKAGDLVTTGTCTPVIEVGAGDTAMADFGSLGQVSVSFA